jgi:signal transduction histidine kinase
MIAVLLTSAAFSGPEVVAMHRVTFAIIGLAPFFFLFGLLRPRFAVGPLLLALREARGSDERRNALAAALGDPSLDVLYSLPETNEYATSSGQVVELPAPDDERAVTHVQSEGHPVGALVHDGSLRSEPELVRNVAAAATFALENERLQAELQASLRQVAESRARIVRASDDERRRLERNLHDGAQQQLLSLSVTLSLLESRAAADPATRDLMRTAREQLAESLAGLRELARGIHPAVLSDHGLAVALETVVARTPLPVLLSVETERLPPPVEVAVYYLVCETLANVARHSRATQAEVLIARRGDWAAADVADNGVGGADPSSGSGLRGLADRIEALGGSLSIESPPGSGTRIAARIPC